LGESRGPGKGPDVPLVFRHEARSGKNIIRKPPPRGGREHRPPGAQTNGEVCTEEKSGKGPKGKRDSGLTKKDSDLSHSDLLKGA